MKRWWSMLLLIAVLAVCPNGDAAAPVTVFARDIQLTGTVSDRDCEVRVTIVLPVEAPGVYRVVKGVCAGTGEWRVTGRRASFWRGAPTGRLHVDGDGIYLEADAAGVFDLELPLALPVAAEGAVRWVTTEFLPALTGRCEWTVAEGVADFEQINALRDGGYIWNGGELEVQWRMAAADSAAPLWSGRAWTMLSVGVGMVRMCSENQIQVTRGQLRELVFPVPEGWNVSSLELMEDVPQAVRWNFNRADRLVTVAPVGGFAANFGLRIWAERPLSALPATFVFSSFIGVEGEVGIGATPGVRLERQSAAGLTQSAEIPALTRRLELMFPSGGVLTCYSAAREFQAEFLVTAVTPVFTAESETAVQLKDSSLLARYDARLEVRDAPLARIDLDFDGALSFRGVVSDWIRPQDYEIVPLADGRKQLQLFPTHPVLGKVEFSASFESELGADRRVGLSGFALPGVRSCRGTFGVSAEKGLNLEAVSTAGLTAVPPGTLAVRTAGLIQAYLYRNEAWNWAATVTLAERHVTGEVFSLVTAGESGAYGFTLFTAHLAGAPLDKLKFRVSDRYENLEFSGVPLVGAKRLTTAPVDGFHLWEVEMRRKHSGELTLLASYEISRSADNRLPAGALHCVDAEPEAVFIAVAGSKEMSSRLAGPVDAVLELENDELPEEYRNMIGNPLLQLFRAERGDGWCTVELSSFAKEPLSPLLVEAADYRVQVDSNGHRITTGTLLVKNATAQFLTLRLPPESQLWQIKINDRIERASAADGMLLIPLPRPERINDEIRIELVYATAGAPPTAVERLTFPLPVISAPVLRRTCQIELPERCAVAGTVPALAGRPPSGGGMPGMITLIAGWGFGLIATVLAVGLGYGLARRRLTWILLGAVLGGVSALVLLANVAGLLGRDWSALQHKGSLGHVVTFTDIADFGAAPEQLVLLLGNGAVQSGYWGWVALAALAVGIGGVMVRRRWLAAPGFGLALAALALTGTAELWMVIYGLLAVIPVAVPIVAGRWAFRHWRGVAAMAFALLGAAGLGAAEVESYRLELTPAGENIRAEGEYRLRLTEGDGWKFAPAAWRMAHLELPDGVRMAPNSAGDWTLAGRTAGEAEQFRFSALLPSDEGESGRGFLIVVPAALSGEVVVRLTPEWTATAPGAVRSEWADLPEAGVRERRFRFPVGGGEYRIELERRAALEIPAELQGELNSELLFRRDVAELTLRARLNVAQGAVSAVRFALPPGMTVRHVECDDLNTWTVGAEDHILEVFFNTPRSREFILTVTLSRYWERLPAEMEFTAPHLLDAAMESGVLKVTAVPEVRLRERDVVDFTPVNAPGMTAEHRMWTVGAAGAMGFVIDEVIPEIRVEEQCEVRYEDERILLDAMLTLDVVKGGVFAVDLGLPEGFEIVQLTGPEVAHWTEKRTAGRGEMTVHFKNRLSGATQLQLRLAGMSNGAYQQERVPKLTVVGAQKLSGSLTVLGERGTALTVTAREGVALTERGRDGEGGGNSLYFKLLNPGWQVDLRFDAAAPWIQAELYQTVKMRLNSVDTEIAAYFKIENNGVKTLEVQLPENLTLPEFDARDLVRAQPLGRQRWQLELSGKVERQLVLRIRGRLTAGADGTVAVEAVRFPDAAAQSGYLAVYTADSLELKPPQPTGDVSDVNLRTLPPELTRLVSNTPVAAFRTIGVDWRVGIAAVSNQNAGMLKLAVNALALHSRFTANGVVLHRVKLTAENNGEAFLRCRLPEGAAFWGATVNGIAVETVRAADGYLLLPVDAGSGQQIEFAYTEQGAGGRHVLLGPVFDAPLRDISWRVSGPERGALRFTGGNLEPRPAAVGSMWSGGAIDRSGNAPAKFETDLMNESRQLRQDGDVQRANRMMRNALDLTQDVALRRDLQGEMLLNNREFNLTNLNRRQKMLARSRLQSGSADASGGDAAEAAPNPGMQQVADKIFTQQQAVYAAAQIYELNWAESPDATVFARAQEINRNAPLQLDYALDPVVAAPAAPPVGGIPFWVWGGLIFGIGTGITWLLLPGRKTMG